MIKVLVVEDSSVVKTFLVYCLALDPEIEVTSTANNGIEAVVKAVKLKKPHIITMDINMPDMNGLETIRKIMESVPVPVVIVTGSYDTTEVATTYRALEAGAVAIVQRPCGIGHPEHETTLKELVRTVKLMSEVKVVRRWPAVQRKTGIRAVSPPETTRHQKIQVVAMGASTGGPVALQIILSGLPMDFPLPVLIVQHIAEGFTRGFTKWLNQDTDLSVHVA
ncbi:MAG: response regulator, partial [Thermodesulfobacteriota bacterium]|nr:response regulator [Thermodesulfobacteriota bacterium]